MQFVLQLQLLHLNLQLCLPNFIVFRRNIIFVKIKSIKFEYHSVVFDNNWLVSKYQELAVKSLYCTYIQGLPKLLPFWEYFIEHKNNVLEIYFTPKIKY